MKKYLLTIILFILIIPTIVIAGTCNPSDIEIKSVTLSKTLGTGEEVTAANVDNKSINLDVKLNNPNDYMEYTITVKNNSTEDYYIKEEDFNNNNNNQYLKYEFVHENNEYLIEPSEEKEITLRVSYTDRVEGTSNYVSTDTISLNVLNNQTVQVANTIKNISIGLVIFIVIMFILIFSGIITISHNSKNLLMIIIALVIFLPLSINAACESSIDVDVKVELDNKNAIFDNGVNIVYKIKALSGTTIVSQYGYYTRDYNVTAIKRSTTEPTSSNKEDKNIVSAPSSSYPIYMWYQNGIVYWWSEDETPSLNENAQAMFACFENLVDIADLKYFDASNCTNYTSIFDGLTLLDNIESLRNWNVSNATTLSDIFDGDEAISDFSPISNWDVSNVKNLSWAFCCANGLTNLDAFANWSLPKLEKIEGIFCYAENLEDISILANWDISNVTSLSEVFEGCYALTNLDALSNWNTSKVTNICFAFGEMTSLADITGIMYWDVSKVEDFSSSFEGNTALTTLDLSHWNTESATNMSYIFYNDKNIIEIDITGWETGNVTTMRDMFNHCEKLEVIHGIEYINTSSVIKLMEMFGYCKKLTSLDLHRWDVSKVDEMYSMFSHCTSLATIDVSGWHTPNLRRVQYMFNTIKVSVLDLSTWDTRKVTSFRDMFNASTQLTTIYIGENWDTSKNTDTTSAVFPDNCNLPNFSTSNENYKDLSWAKPTTQGGYLTLKTNS